MSDLNRDLRAVREQLPSLDGGTYLNTGGVGPLPLAAARALGEWSRQAPHRGRGRAAGFE